uniref:Selenide, water dikinase n=1 Tax=Desulfobacca acetoxidans TaxID=60893 RepID=A0A7C3ZA19_9BACT
MPPGVLEEILAGLPVRSDPNLLVGIETADDAGVYRLTDEIALIQTVDFFTPIVNDPYIFGQIAAANALSDVYAMGGRPLTALNIVCYPSKTVSKEVLKAILAGGLDKVHEAGALLVGGHSVDDTELKYGLSVTGVVHPQRVLTNAGAQVGDRLILTKPLGTGIIATAIKGRAASPEAEAQAVAVMVALNREAAECLEGFTVHAVTDVTGFGLLGHALEMAAGSGVELTLSASRVPILAAAREYATMGLVPAGTFANRNFCQKSLRVAGTIDVVTLDLLADAQTNGGLLIAVAGDQAETLLARLHDRGVAAAALIGEVTAVGPGAINLKD